MSAKPNLVWDSWDRRHIKKHHVTPKEVEEAYRQSHLSLPGHTKRKLFYGKTKNNRYITIITSTRNQPNPYVVTARDMNIKERSNYEKVHSPQTN